MAVTALRDLLELVRAPAALSVPGDVVAGAAAGQALGGRTLGLACSSVCLYWAGMAANDWADRRLDEVERPERPIPSGRVSPGTALAVAAGLGAEAVSFWSGGRPAHTEPSLAWNRLVDGCAQVLETARRIGVPLGVEPEPGMLVETIADWRALHQALGPPEGFGITLDIGHCRCNEPDPVPACVTSVAEYLVNVQIDDMRRGTHEHLEFGEGEIDFPPVLRALDDAGYRGLVTVELPRHAHAAPDVAVRSIGFLHRAEQVSVLTAGVEAS
ncbi:TIM barrel protein [Streptomyces sp. NPDC057580]|uniref:TIM barrel protein n=1 Tax=Streptomyces sp. NPDC057580 TaxID=3346173 RepID=UPI0036A0D59E